MGLLYLFVYKINAFQFKEILSRTIIAKHNIFSVPNVYCARGKCMENCMKSELSKRKIITITIKRKNGEKLYNVFSHCKSVCMPELDVCLHDCVEENSCYLYLRRSRLDGLETTSLAIFAAYSELY